MITQLIRKSTALMLTIFMVSALANDINQPLPSLSWQKTQLEGLIVKKVEKTLDRVLQKNEYTVDVSIEVGDPENPEWNKSDDPMKKGGENGRSTASTETQKEEAAKQEKEKKELADKEKSIFALTEKAKYEMNNSNFKEAKKFWKKLVDKVENDTYFVQQLALCTYKDKTISPNIALIDALGIIKQLEPDDRNTIDPETLGITGAIYKRLWENNNAEIEYLDRAIEYYKRGFTINQDYYTGENYALCLNLKASITTNSDEKIYLNYSAKETRKEIIEIIQKLAEDEDFEIRSDLMWIYATLSNCYMGIEDEENHQLYEKKFKELNPVDWQQETYEKSLNYLKELLK